MTKRKIIRIVSLIIASIFVLTSCGQNSGSKAGKDIQEVVEAYFDEIADGTFAEAEYESDYSTDNPFSDATFEDEAVIPIMQKAFETIEFEVTDATGDEEEEEGSCDIVLTAVNVEEVLGEMEEGFTAEDLEEAILDKDAPTEDFEVTLDVEFDSDEEEWLISDTSEIAEILAEPYAEISFAPQLGDPLDTLNDFLAALASGDTEAVDEISLTYSSFTMFDGDVASDLRKAFYGYVSFEPDADAVISDYGTSLTGTLTYPNAQAITDAVFGDTENMALIMKDYLYALVNDQDTVALEEEMDQAVDEATILYLNNSSDYLAETVTFEFVSAEGVEHWILSYVPEQLYTFPEEPTTAADQIVAIMSRSAEMLLDEGSISLEVYNQILADLGVLSVSGEDLQADAGPVSFWNFTLNEYVTEYDSATTYQIGADVLFAQDWTGQNIQLLYVWYGDNGTTYLDTLYGTMTLNEAGDCFSFCDYPTVENATATLAPGIYWVYVYASDNTLVSQGSVEVT
jgi:predicted small secreted protein